MWHIRARQYDCVAVALQSFADDMHDTSNVLRTDNNVYPVRPSIACRTLRKCNSQRENLCPSRRHEPFPLYLQPELCLQKNGQIQNNYAPYLCGQTFSTASTFRSKHAVIIVDTVNFIVHINGEWNTIQTFIANTTTEAAWMVGFSHRL